MIEGIENLIAIENEQGLDVFKESVSLASLTQKYLQRNLSDSDYFTGISEQHKHIHKDLKKLWVLLEVHQLFSIDIIKKMSQ